MQASPDDVNSEGDTALHIACKQGHIGIVNLLMENRASLTVCNTQGLTCLEVAVRTGKSDVAMAMVKNSRYALSICASNHNLLLFSKYKPLGFL